MATFSKEEIEQRAEALRARQLGRKPKVPVDVEELVRRLRGAIQVRYGGYHHPESLHIAGDGSFTVFVPSNTSLRRDRFTIAHELGHYELHHDRTTKEPVSFQRYGRSRQETEANAFAGALLMPTASFRAAWRDHDGDLEAVARQFLVSRSAADVRRQVLDLA